MLAHPGQRVPHAWKCPGEGVVVVGLVAARVGEVGKLSEREAFGRAGAGRQARERERAEESRREREVRVRVRVFVVLSFRNVC